MDCWTACTSAVSRLRCVFHFSSFFDLLLQVRWPAFQQQLLTDRPQQATGVSLAEQLLEVSGKIGNFLFWPCFLILKHFAEDKWSLTNPAFADDALFSVCMLVRSSSLSSTKKSTNFPRNSAGTMTSCFTLSHFFAAATKSNRIHAHSKSSIMISSIGISSCCAIPLLTPM